MVRNFNPIKTNLMKQLIALITIFSLIISCNKPKKMADQINTPNQTQNIYQFKLKTLDGSDFDFVSLKGKKIMLVNTASKCGLTPQYKYLQALYEKYNDKGFTIIGFPANNFGAQEPGTNTEIKKFCSINYGVTFPMMAKISVKGNDIHPMYQFLTQKSKNGLQDSEVTWNFQKYLINKNGMLEMVISPKTLPNSSEIINWIENN